MGKRQCDIVWERRGREEMHSSKVDYKLRMQNWTVMVVVFGVRFGGEHFFFFTSPFARVRSPSRLCGQRGIIKASLPYRIPKIYGRYISYRGRAYNEIYLGGAVSVGEMPKAE